MQSFVSTPERFQISWMMDAESGELGAMLQDLLERGVWQTVVQVSGAMVAGGPPRGVIVETDLQSSGVETLVQWMSQVNLNPQVNRGEQKKFNILTGMGDGPPPVHIVAGVIPR